MTLRYYSITFISFRLLRNTGRCAVPRCKYEVCLLEKLNNLPLPINCHNSSNHSLKLLLLDILKYVHFYKIYCLSSVKLIEMCVSQKLEAGSL